MIDDDYTMGDVFRAMTEANKIHKAKCFENNLEKLNNFLATNKQFTAKTDFNCRHTTIYKDGKKVCLVYLSKQRFETIKKKYLN